MKAKEGRRGIEVRKVMELERKRDGRGREKGRERETKVRGKYGEGTWERGEK